MRSEEGKGRETVRYNDYQKQIAINKLKDLIMEEIFLSFLDYSPNAKSLVLFGDASCEGAGACLCQ